MSALQTYLGLVAWGLAALALGIMAAWQFAAPPLLIAALALGTFSLARFGPAWPAWMDGAAALLGAAGLLLALPMLPDPRPAWFWLGLLAVWFCAWMFAERLADAIAGRKVSERGFGLLIPLGFGAMVLLAWEVATRAGNVPLVILPPPSAIAARFSASYHVLWVDFVQTFIKSVLPGYAIGCGVGFAVAVLVDRSPFFKKSLLPLGNFLSAMPIIGIAPILVLWFGYDWQSKAAVVAVLVFFPMLVNTVAGLAAAGHMERDLLRTYAAGYWQALWTLRLPAAAPFVFNALKINSTLALIGAIVAEFFGTPTVGMGFRINTEVGRLNVDMVWAVIAVAAVAGSAFYGVIALIERRVTFWHPSIRGG